MVKALPTELLRVVAAKVAPKLDVVFIHGLNGDPLVSWGFNTRPSWATWISEKHPQISVWSLRYRVESSWWRGGSMPLFDRALNVIATMQTRLVDEQPLALICHSYGGLLAKQLLRSAELAPEYRSLVGRVEAIVFFGTPHSGSSIPNYIRTLSAILRSSSAMHELRRNGGLLRDLDHWFRNNVDTSRVKIISYYETMPTFGLQVVDEESADPKLKGVNAVGIDANHFDLPRPTTADARVRQVLNVFDNIVKGNESKDAARERRYRQNTLDEQNKSDYETMKESGIEQAVYKYLPILRLFGRSISGNQRIGDKFVAATVKYLADHIVMPDNLSVKTYAFRVLVRHWNDMADIVLTGDDAGIKKFSNLTPVHRQAYIMHVICGLEVFEVAEALSVTVSEVRSIFVRAGREITEQKKLMARILIVEDERLIQLEFATIITQLGHTVVGVAENRSEAIEIINDQDVDLILCDIQLKGGDSGLDLMTEILATKTIPFIVATAFPERFLTGSGPEPAFLVAKPFSSEQIALAITQALFIEEFKR